MVGSYEGSHVMVISPHAVAIVGFSSGEKVVNEGERIGVCTSVTEPGSSLVMLLNFFLVVDLIPLTEGLCVVCVRVCVCMHVCVHVHTCDTHYAVHNCLHLSQKF